MKRVLLSAVMALVLVAALAATSLAIDVSGPDIVEPGDTITISVTGEGAGISGAVETKGLTVTGVTGGFSTTQDVLLVDAHGGLTANYTCRVTADAGESVSFTVTDVVVSDGSDDHSAEGASWRAVVEEGEPDPTTKPTDTQRPTQTPVVTQPPQTSAPVTEQPTGDQNGATAEPEPTESDSNDGSQIAPAGQKTPEPSQSAASKAEHLPKTADSSLDLWTFLSIGAGLAVIIVIAGRKVYARL